MAYIPNEQEEEQQLSGQGGVVGGGTQQAGQRPTSSGTFTNLQKFVDVNKPQTAKMAGTIADNIRGQKQQIQEGITQAGQEYQQSITPYIEKAEIKKDILQKFQDGSATPEQYSSWGGGKLWETPTPTPQYDFTAQEQAIKDYEDRLKKTEEEQGRMNELKAIQKGDITRGEALLNQTLMQQDPVAKQTFENLRAQDTPTLTAAQNEANIQRQALIDLRNQNQAMLDPLYQTSQQLTTGLSDAEQAYTDAVAANRAEVDAYNDMLWYFKRRDLDPGQAPSQEFYDSLRQYDIIDRGEYVTPEMIAREEALRTLMSGYAPQGV